MTKPAETGELERARSERMGQEVADARWNLRKRLVSFWIEKTCESEGRVFTYSTIDLRPPRNSSRTEGGCGEGRGLGEESDRIGLEGGST